MVKPPPEKFPEQLMVEVLAVRILLFAERSNAPQDSVVLPKVSVLTATLAKSVKVGATIVLLLVFNVPSSNLIAESTVKLSPSEILQPVEKLRILRVFPPDVKVPAP